MISQRINGSQAGKLELPGGKVEEGESLRAALVRELEEEVGVNVKENNMFPVACSGIIERSNGRVPIQTIMFLVDNYKGGAISKEGQPVREE